MPKNPFLLNPSLLRTDATVFTELQNNSFTHRVIELIRFCRVNMRCTDAAEVHVTRPQAGAAAGGVKGVGLKPAAIKVLDWRRHAELSSEPNGWLVLNHPLTDQQDVLSQEIFVRL